MPTDPRFEPASQVVRCLVLYALAEAQAGHANRIHVVLDGGRFAVSDNGRGHAVDRRVDGVPYLQLVYDHLDWPFGLTAGPAVQLQGLGTSLVRSLCSDLVVTARRDGLVHRVRIAPGGPDTASEPLAPGASTGNTIAGVLRAELPTTVDAAALRGWLRAAAGSVPGLAITAEGSSLAPLPPPGPPGGPQCPPGSS